MVWAGLSRENSQQLSASALVACCDILGLEFILLTSAEVLYFVAEIHSWFRNCEFDCPLLCQGIDVLSEEDKKEKCQQNATVLAHTFAFLPSCDLKRALSTQYN